MIIPFSYWGAKKLEIPTQGLTHFYDFKGATDWQNGGPSVVKDFAGGSNGNLSSNWSWNSGNGGHIQFRSGADCALNKTAASLGFFYSPFSIVSVARNPNMDNLSMILASNNPSVTGSYVYNADAYQNNVHVGFAGYKYRHSHNTLNPPDTWNDYGTMNSNTWYHIVSTYNYSNYQIKIYVNGQLFVTGSQERIIGNQWYYIARYGGISFPGQSVTTDLDLGLLMCYNRVLTDEEVSTLYQIQKTRFGI